MAKILIIDDDKLLSATIKDWLSNESHLIETVHSAREALEYLQMSKYDIIVLDWELPDGTGIEILKRYRALGGVTSVIMLTGRTKIDDKEEGLDAGADDYLTKPFDVKELSARVRAILRRPDRTQSNSFKRGRILLDPKAHTVTKDGTPVKLFRKEFALLEFLFSRPQEVFTVEQLHEAVWNSEPGISPETVRTSVRRIRQQLDTDGEPSVIENVRGSGYRIGECRNADSP
jgi:DNA-binding response OmpR family regulator